jgi:hypothetical protein
MEAYRKLFDFVNPVLIPQPSGYKSQGSQDILSNPSEKDSPIASKLVEY